MSQGITSTMTIGVDLGDRYSVGCVIDDEGVVETPRNSGSQPSKSGPVVSPRIRRGKASE